MKRFQQFLGLLIVCFFLVACREVKEGKTDFFNSVYYSSSETTVAQLQAFVGGNYQESEETIQGETFTKYEFDKGWLVYENDRGKTAAAFPLHQTFNRQELDDLLVDFDIVADDLETFDHHSYEGDYFLAESNNSNVYRLYLEELEEGTYRFAALYNLAIIKEVEATGYPE